MANSSQSVLDVIVDRISQRPQSTLLLILLIVGFWFSLPVVAIALLFYLILHLFSIRIVLLTILMSLLMIFLAYWACHVTFKSIHLQSDFLYRRLFYKNISLSIPYFWICALPYGVLIGCVMRCLSNMSSRLQNELKRVGSGLLRDRHSSVPRNEIEKMLKKIECSAVVDGAILGVNHRDACQAVLNDQSANLHTLAVGTTGSGKTTGVSNIIESAIVRGHPVFYVDGKGDLNLASSIQKFAESCQLPFYLFSMKGASLKYNPISLGGYTSKKDRLIELRSWSEDHYRKIAEGYLQTVFKLLDQRDIVVDLMALSNYLEPEALYRLARQYKDNEMMDMIASLEPAYSQISSLIREIRNIAESEIGDLFDTSSGNVINLESVLKKGGVVYFCLQPLAFPAYAETLGKLIINDIKSLLASQLERTNFRKLYAVFDEFSVFAGDQIVNLINQGRGAGMHAILATQSLSDIQRKGGNALLGQVLNNTNNYIILRQNYSEDAEILANVIGTRVAFEVTSQLSSEYRAARMGTVRQTREFIIHPDEIKRLEQGEAILITKQPFQVQPIYLRKGKI